MTFNNPSVFFVSRTASNNGVSAFVDHNGTEPYKAGCITLAFGGSIGSCFVQYNPFYTGQNIGVIDFGEDISLEAKQYIAICLGKYCKAVFTAFADEINRHFKEDLSVTLPITQDRTPDLCNFRGESATQLRGDKMNFKICELCNINQDGTLSLRGDIEHKEDIERWLTNAVRDAHATTIWEIGQVEVDLPVKPKIDFDYMRNYIKAVEKDVFRDLGYNITDAMLPWWMQDKIDFPPIEQNQETTPDGV